MVKEIIVANENFEDLVEDLKTKIESIECEKEAEKEKAFKEIEEKYQIRLIKFNEILSDPDVSHIETIEIPDEVVEDTVEEEIEV